jgi:hypothetical protein
VRIGRLTRVRVIAIATLAFVFAQLSVAAYACPLAAAAAPHDMSTMDCEEMATQLDPTFPNLCLEHCQYGEQTDQVRIPTAPAVSLTSLYIVPHHSSLVEPTQLVVVSSGLLVTRPPPHTILHCCFRI